MSDTSSAGDLTRRILESIFFKRSQRQAQRLVRNTTGLWDLLKKVTSKSDTLTNTSLIVNLRLLSRMLRAYAKGDYKVVPWSTLVKIVAALVYFVSPIDFIPDLLPILGFSDDIAIVLWVLSSCTVDIQKFKEWEETNAVVVEEGK